MHQVLLFHLHTAQSTMSTAPLEQSSSWRLDQDSIVSSDSLRQENIPVLLNTSSRFVSTKRASFSAIKPQKRKANDITDLTMDKLRFERVGLHGRQNEISKLNELYQSLRLVLERRVVLISGHSGTGKTKLAETLEHHASQSCALFVKGKYDSSHRSQPYSGIANACAEICGSIHDLQRQDPEKATAICEEIEASVGVELPLLFQAIPTLGEILHKPDPVLEMRLLNSSKSLSSQNSKDRVLFAFVRFMRVITKYYAPLVFVIDDLQWADSSSLDLLDALILDHAAMELMLVGIYRSNEVDETHALTSFLHILESRSCNQNLTLTRLAIENLNIQDVQLVIQDLLQCEDSAQSRELAEICHEKTNGNPFFLMRFVSMLQDRQLLQFNYGSLSWTWNGEAIKQGTSACDNVVQLLIDQMNRLPRHLLELLKVASCLGSTFDYRYIEIAWKTKSSNDVPEGGGDKTCLEALDELSRGGFLIRVSCEQLRFSWVHDKIREAATTLIPESQRCSYMREMGQIFIKGFTVEELDTFLFVVVDLLNFSPINDLDTDGRQKLSDLNLVASKKAIKLSSFESAAKYAGKGIEFLDDFAWDEDDYMVPLQLYSIGAKAEGFLGNLNVMEQYCNIVISNNRIPLERKLEVYNTLVEGMADRSRVADAAVLILEVLSKFNCRFPKTRAIVKANIMANVFLVKRKLKDHDPSNLPILNDDAKLQLMNLLDHLSYFLYILNDSRMPLVMLRSLMWTLKYGISAYSASSLATTGLILTGVLDDIQGGAVFGQHALSVLKKTESSATAARNIFNVHAFVFPWSRPLRDCLKPLIQAYDIGFQNGDTETSSNAIYFWLIFKFILGASLESLEADIELYLRQMNDLKKAQAAKITSTLCQLVLNLMRRDNLDDPTRFYGKGLTLEQYDVSRTKPVWNAIVCCFHGVLLTFFGQHIRKADFLVEKGHDYLAKTYVASPCIMLDTYLNGVSCFAAARETGKSHYAKLGETCRAKIKKWIRKGNPNVKHYEALLDAEAMAWRGKHSAAVKYFETAILLSGRGGYQHYLALASERFGEFQLSIMKDHDEGVYRLKEAARYWRSWGAHAKAESLEQRNAAVFGLQKSTDLIGLNISVSSRRLLRHNETPQKGMVSLPLGQ